MELEIVELDEATKWLWHLEVEKAYPELRGRYTPADLFDQVKLLRDEFRALSRPSESGDVKK